ncbi:hypothetical protein MXAN_4484 [Myxococcus xanthus DK 1622]|uniref:Uncharacterized protein n=1 Tax=Myxococcus xanthus (strain DK1622) TaxID=246197 RepID=Q1D3X0_MYXXD|nr:hypothetical protein MXAN_4484 [Myxococcus xanthus DK 1622]
MPLGSFLKDRFGSVRPIAKQMRGGHHAHVQSLMLEQHGESVTSGIAVGQELIDGGTVLPGVLVPDLGVSPEDGLVLSGHVLGELLDKILQLHHQSPFSMFLRANNPNSLAYSGSSAQVPSFQRRSVMIALMAATPPSFAAASSTALASAVR